MVLEHEACNVVVASSLVVVPWPGTSLLFVIVDSTFVLCSLDPFDAVSRR